MGPFVPARTNIAAASMSPTTANTSSNRFIAYPGISDLKKCGRGTHEFPARYLPRAGNAPELSKRIPPTTPLFPKQALAARPTA